MIFSKQPQRDNIEIMLARKCGFYIRGKQQGLAEDEISMPILMTQTLHEMLVHFADEVRTITKAVYDVEIEPLRVRATQAENIALEQQAEITSLRAELEKAKKDGERWRYLVDNKANIVTVENEKRGYRSTMPNAVWERWSEFEGYMISTSTTNETFKTYDEAIDNAMKGNS